MATRTIVTTLDDVDGSEAAGSRYFGLEGVEYEIDLSESNSAALTAALRPWIAAARRLGKTSLPKARNGLTAFSTPGKRDTRPIREWAAENGFQVAIRGAVSRDVMAAYDAAKLKALEPAPVVEAPKPTPPPPAKKAPAKKATARKVTTPKFTA